MNEPIKIAQAILARTQLRLCIALKIIEQQGQATSQTSKCYGLHFANPAEGITDDLLAKIKYFCQLFFHQQGVHDPTDDPAG